MDHLNWHSEDSLHPGIFRGFVDLVADLDTALAEHLSNATVLKGASKTFQNELLDCMLETYKLHVADDIQNTSFLSIQADETTDASCKSQFVIILHYIIKCA